MTKTIEEILTSKPTARLRIYAYTIDDEAHRGLLKIGQTSREVKQRVAEQLKTAAIKNYRIELDEPPPNGKMVACLPTLRCVRH